MRALETVKATSIELLPTYSLRDETTPEMFCYSSDFGRLTWHPRFASAMGGKTFSRYLFNMRRPSLRWPAMVMNSWDEQEWLQLPFGKILPFPSNLVSTSPIASATVTALTTLPLSMHYVKKKLTQVGKPILAMRTTVVSLLVHLVGSWILPDLSRQISYVSESLFDHLTRVYSQQENKWLRYPCWAKLQPFNFVKNFFQTSWLSNWPSPSAGYQITLTKRTFASAQRFATMKLGPELVKQADHLRQIQIKSKLFISYKIQGWYRIAFSIS